MPDQIVPGMPTNQFPGDPVGEGQSLLSAIGIQTLTNLLTGTAVEATLSGEPTGILEFWASEVYDAPEFAVPFTGQGVWTLILPYPGLWYVWAKDDEGFGAQYAAVVCGLSNDPDLDAIGMKLRAILEGHKLGFEAYLQSWYPGTTVKQFHYGLPSGINAFPSVIVTNPRVDWDWKATGYVKKWTYTFDIALMVERAEEQTETPLVTRMLEAALSILNIRRYTRLTVASGLPLYYCRALQGNATEIEIPDVGWASVASCVWMGWALKQVGSGRPA